MIVKRMVDGMKFPVTIEPVPAQRTEAGLAMSPWNLLLSGEQEESAVALSKALSARQERAQAGPRLGSRRASQQVRNIPDVTLGCLEVVDSATLEGAPELQALALIAAYEGSSGFRVR